MRVEAIDLAGRSEDDATIPSLVRSAASHFGGIEAVVSDDARMTYAELELRVTNVAAGLLARGVQPGDRIAIWAPNSTGWIEAALATYQLGAIVVPLNTRFKPVEAEYVLRKSRARMVFTVSSFLDVPYADHVRKMALEEPPGVVLLDGTDGCTLSRLAREYSDSDLEAVESAAASVAGEDVSDVIFTSGTTGAPKGVMLTHAAGIDAYRTWAGLMGLRCGDRYYLVAPFFHMFGLKAGILACVAAGVTMYPRPTFDPADLLATIESERISMLAGPPTIFESLLDHPDIAQTDLASVRLAMTGATVIPADLIRRMRSELPLERVLTGYGLTESGGVASICSQDDAPETVATTVGRAFPGVELRIDGAPEPGQPGEVLIRSPYVMTGYFEEPDETGAAFDDDAWLRSGDLGTLDTDGYLRITGRKKDMFIVGGFNCYPAEIENVIGANAEVSDVAVVGMPDERLGEVGCAYVVPRNRDVFDPGELIAWCRETLANFKVPRRIVVVDELPMNAAGKVLKEELRLRAMTQT